MTTIVAIRTHRWDEDAARLHAELAPVFGDALVVAFHNRPRDLQLPAPVVDLDDAWLARNGLRHVADWGWRCGDYFLYAVRQAYPDASHIWLIEPDVHFTGKVADFFSLMAKRSDDFLGVQIEPMDKGHRFGRGLPGMDLWRAIFALTRFSGRAADMLLPLRQAYGKGNVAPRFYTNDETFCVSHLRANPDMTMASMATLAPDWFPEGSVATDPDVLIDALHGRTAPGVFHPVRGHAGFAGAVASRVTQNMGFLGAMRGSLALLSEEELAAIAADVGRRCHEALLRARRA